MTQLLTIFFNVLTPVFALVLIGYLVAPRLQLEARTLSRVAYFVLTPAFTVDVLGTAHIAAALAVRMTVYIMVVQVVCAGVGYTVARLLRRDAQMTAAYVLIAVWGNVGNFGIPIIQFALGREALPLATVYFLAITTVAFPVGVAAANWQRGLSVSTLLAVLKTPGLIAIVPALLLNALHLELPLAVARPVSLLSAAMVPTMLLTLGAQLAQAGIPRPSRDMLVVSAVRLVAGPLIALGLVIPFGLYGLERSVGVLQASMPVAVLASIIAFENDLLPNFVTATVLFSTLASMVTLTIVLLFV